MPEVKSKYALEIVDDPGRVVNGLWWLSYDRLTLVDAAWVGKPVVLVPTEDIRLLAVALPIPNRTQRLAALPFAIEDDLAEPLDVLHIVLGAELEPGRYLAGAVRHDRMVAWSVLLAEAGLANALLVPDALALPTPVAPGWSVALKEGRVMVRTDVGSGFVVPFAAFQSVWVNAGRPSLASYGEPLVEAEQQDRLGDGWVVWPVLSQPPPLDLRQGRYVVQSTTTPWLRRAAMVVALGLLAHGVLLGVDTFALARSADARKAVVEALVIGAGAPPGGDVVATAEAMLPTSAGSGKGMMSLLSRAAKALQPLGTTVTLQSITYSSETGLALSLEASDLAGLQKAEAALAGAGLSHVSTGAAVDGGVAREIVTIAAGGDA